MASGVHLWLEELLPPACALCGGACGCEAVCARCWPTLPLLTPEADAECLAVAAFAGPVADAVHRYKYPAAGLAGLDPKPAALLQALLCEAGARAPGPAPGVVVPVPLHPRRLRRRGFNPAAELARALARERGLRCDPTALRRLRDTPSQTGLDRPARRRNVRGAFAARPGWRAPGHVWLVDDVVTTGSTLREAARALRRAGARSVVALAAARTLNASRASRSAPRAGGPDRRAS